MKHVKLPGSVLSNEEVQKGQTHRVAREPVNRKCGLRRTIFRRKYLIQSNNLHSHVVAACSDPLKGHSGSCPDDEGVVKLVVDISIGSGSAV